MDIGKIRDKVVPVLKKYKYAVLVLVIGLGLMSLPTKTKTTASATQNSTNSVETRDVAQELADILGNIKGVGKVQVMLTVKAGETTVYQTDEDVDTSETGSSIRKETVIITDSDRNQRPLVVQTMPPEYMGAVIVCQGADNASVRLAVVEAVCKATGLGADKISVLKMK